MFPLPCFQPVQSPNAPSTPSGPWWETAGLEPPIARYNASEAASLTLSGADVMSIANTGTGQAPAMFISGSNRKPPTYTASDSLTGRPAVQYQDDGSASFLAIPDGVGGIAEVGLQHLFVVLRYRDGIADAFTDPTGTTNRFVPLISGASGITGSASNRVLGQSGNDFLYAPNGQHVNRVSKNGAAFSNVILPTGDAVVCHFSAAEEGLASFPISALGAAYIGSGWNRITCWDGVFFDVLAYDTALTAQQVADVNTYLMGYHGL